MSSACLQRRRSRASRFCYLNSTFPRSGLNNKRQPRPDFEPSGQPNNDFVVLCRSLLGESARFRSDPLRQRLTSESTFTARPNRVRQPRLTTVPAATRSRLSYARRVRPYPPVWQRRPVVSTHASRVTFNPFPISGGSLFVPFALPPLPTEGPELPSITGIRHGPFGPHLLTVSSSLSFAPFLSPFTCVYHIEQRRTR